MRVSSPRYCRAVTHSSGRGPSSCQQPTWELQLAGPAGEATLTPSEAALIEALLARPGAATPVEALVRALWGEAAAADRHARAAIRTHVRTLRRKLAAAGLAGALATLPRIGYRIDVEG